MEPELFSFPSDHVFKAFGPDDEAFVCAVREAVSTVVPLSLDAIRLRSSAGGKYICVSALVRLHNVDQMRRIYSEIQKIKTLKYLL